MPRGRPAAGCEATTTSGEERVSAADSGPSAVPETTDEEHFKPTGTIFLLVCYVATLILLWVTVYLILLSRGATG